MTARKLTPRQMADAYRIWAYCEPRGWDCSCAEISDALGLNPQYVGRLLAARGWSSRVRAYRKDNEWFNGLQPRYANGSVTETEVRQSLGLDTWLLQ